MIPVYFYNTYNAATVCADNVKDLEEFDELFVSTSKIEAIGEKWVMYINNEAFQVCDDHVFINILDNHIVLTISHRQETN